MVRLSMMPAPPSRDWSTQSIGAPAMRPASGSFSRGAAGATDSASPARRIGISAYRTSLAIGGERPQRATAARDVRSGRERPRDIAVAHPTEIRLGDQIIAARDTFAPARGVVDVNQVAADPVDQG